MDDPLHAAVFAFKSFHILEYLREDYAITKPLENLQDVLPWIVHWNKSAWMVDKRSEKQLEVRQDVSATIKKKQQTEKYI